MCLCMNQIAAYFVDFGKNHPTHYHATQERKAARRCAGRRLGSSLILRQIDRALDAGEFSAPHTAPLRRRRNTSSRCNSEEKELRCSPKRPHRVRAGNNASARAGIFTHDLRILGRDCSGFCHANPILPRLEPNLARRIRALRFSGLPCELS